MKTDKLALVLLVLAFACADRGESSATASPTPSARAPVPTPASPPQGDVNLLRAVPSKIAVSSVYRDEFEQVLRLVDGNPETAWNSATRDLARAWLEIELPPTAQITAIEMTAGFTRRTDRADLFTGNHRIRRVRIIANGTPTEANLDIESRELQRVPVSAQGGRLRIEFAELVPGTQRGWREVCVSEFVVRGTAPGAVAGAHTPTPLIGSLDAAAEETPRPAGFREANLSLLRVLATGQESFGSYVDPERGVVFVDRYENPGEDVQSEVRRATRVCGPEAVRRLNRGVRDILKYRMIEDPMPENPVRCRGLVCSWGGVGEWDLDGTLTFTSRPSGLVLESVVFLESILVEDRYLAERRRWISDQLQRLSTTTCAHE